MNKKVFRASFFTVFLVLFATIVLIFGVLFYFFEKQIQTELQREADFLSQAVENAGSDFFDTFESRDNRVTLVDASGNVLFDSKAAADTLENHAEREEIKEAMETGSGMSIRYSATLTEKTVNFALRLSDQRILRISTNQYTVITILLGMAQPILLILLLALILTLVLSSRVSRALIEPINQLDLEFPENNDTYEELTPLLRKIAEQKQTIQAQLADAQKKQKEFTLLTENMREGFLTIDREANLLTYNSAARKFMDILPPDDGNVLTYCRTKEFRDVITNVLAGTMAERIMVRDGRSYSLIANPVSTDDEVIGAVIVILDITEREKRETLRREFTANVSHELKTPLTSISGFAEMMKEGDMPLETIIDFSASIYDEAQRLITLVNDIIEISQLDEKCISFEQETVDLYTLAEEMICRLKKEAAKRNIALHLIGGKAQFTGVRKILDEMLYNLLDNAVKYNKTNGSVDIIVHPDEEGVTVLVRDTGIGIPAVHQDRVFERFYRVDKSHSKKVGGTGLGLAIVKHGALYHHADIKLESTEHVGTSITLHFPAVEKPDKSGR